MRFAKGITSISNMINICHTTDGNASFIGKTHITPILEHLCFDTKTAANC